MRLKNAIEALELSFSSLVTLFFGYFHHPMTISDGNFGFIPVMRVDSPFFVCPESGVAMPKMTTFCRGKLVIEFFENRLLRTLRL